MPSKSEVKQLSQFCSDEKFQEFQTDNLQSKEAIIDWSFIIETCGDEDVVEKIVKIFLDDAPQCLKLIANAMKIKNFKSIKLYAHRLKGSSRHIAAKQLSETAHRLECAGNENDIEAAALLFEDVKNESKQVMAFLSRDDWMEIAKEQAESKKTEQVAGK